MKKRNVPHLVFMITLSLICVGMFVPAITSAGSLEPAAAPAPTMKTLDEVEPRIPIPASSTAASVYTISESGSYYLAGDRLCSGTGIQVDADNVTIDLMGYSLIGPGSGTNYGILMDGSSNVEIKNGTISNFSYGILEQSSLGESHRAINVRAIKNKRNGIFFTASGCMVKDCTVNLNGSSSAADVYGIYVNYGSIVINNTVHGNGNSATQNVYGLFAGFGSEVTNNVVSVNGSNCGGIVYGIYTAINCSITNNTVYLNGNSAASNVNGILANGNSTVDGNTITRNGMNTSSYVYGIYSMAGVKVTNNTVSENGTLGQATGIGINLLGNNLVDGNIAYQNNTTNISSCGSCTFGTNHAPVP